MNETIGTEEIAKLLGVTRHHLTTKIIPRPGFPKPVVHLSNKIKRWDKQEIMKYVSRPHKCHEVALSD